MAELEPHAPSKGLNRPCILLITISGMERFAFKGVASNLVTYLTDVMGMSNSSAAKFVNSWVGFTSMLPLVIATLADSYWDRHNTILASSVLYSAGLLALTSTAVRWPWAPPRHNTHSVSSLSWSLYMISLGQAGYNPSLQAFGADQLEKNEENDDELPVSNTLDEDRTKGGDSDRKSKFFQWWYFGICCGSLLGVSVMSYVQDNLGWGLGFAIPTLSMLVSIVLFSCGNRLYVRKRSGIANARSFEVVVRAVKAAVSKIVNGGGTRQPGDSDYAIVELELQEQAALCDPDPPNPARLPPLEALRAVLRLLPIWTTLLVFAVVFQQPATFFTKQGSAMNRAIGGTHFEIPPAALQGSITISIILLMPLYDRAFIPLIRALTCDPNGGISVERRIGIGMFLSVVAMVVAAITERKRRLAGNNLPSIFWLLPQYVLLGISDIFTVVGMQEFFYSEVPAGMRTVGIALYTSVFGVGGFLSAVLISVIERLTTEWFVDDMAKARLDKYYWFLAGASAVSLLAFVGLCRWFRGHNLGL
ncbi:major facilitator superfamily protein [Striga asiatica]|uniref:Major facilitator superfamily protein n=1 Tax=Striga asiatica TaxID=4170 RepID=A0A5A7P9B7_STRAF|nr:major facilitator superfamily protein [Striga asiatica]